MSTQELQDLEERVQATLADPASTEVTLTLTEQQLNGYIAAKLDEQGEQTFSDPQVDLANGQMVVYGKATQSGITVDTTITMVPRIDENGDPTLDVVSIDLGPFPVPQALNDRVEAMVDDTLSDYVAASSDQFKVTDVAVGEDEMTITGIKQP